MAAHGGQTWSAEPAEAVLAVQHSLEHLTPQVVVAPAVRQIGVQQDEGRVAGRRSRPLDENVHDSVEGQRQQLVTAESGNGRHRDFPAAVEVCREADVLVGAPERHG